MLFTEARDLFKREATVYFSFSFLFPRCLNFLKGWLVRCTELRICQQMARDNWSHKEAAMQVRYATRRTSKPVSRRRDVQALSRQPMGSTSPAVEPSVHPIPRSPRTDTPAVFYANVCVTNRRAIISRSSQSNIPLCPAIFDSLMAPRTKNAKIFAMLKTLIRVIRTLNFNFRTSTATAAPQTLNTVIPVMNCMEGSQ